MKKINKNAIYYKTFSPSSRTPLEIAKSHGEGSKLKKVFSHKKTEGATTYTMVGSREIKDRDGDIVMLEGIDYTYFEKNPVVLWAHDSHSLPIGKVVSVHRDEKTRTEYFEIEFAKVGIAPTVEELVETGFLKATSIGFMVKDWEYDEKVDAYKFTETELFEISVCNVPANQDAVMEDEEKSVETKTLSLSAEEVRDMISVALAEALADKVEDETPAEASVAPVVEPEVELETKPLIEEESPAETADEVTTSHAEENETNLTAAQIEAVVAATLAALGKGEEESPAEVASSDEPSDEGEDEDRSEEIPSTSEVVNVEELSDDETFVITHEEE